MKTLYLAYGSNLNLDQMNYRCPSAKPVGTTVLENYRITFKGRPFRAVATIEPEEGSTVPGLIWELYDKDLFALDRYEGWPHLYRKEKLIVNLDGKETEVMAYIMNDLYPYNEPDANYYLTIRDGYLDNQMDTNILEKALNRVERLVGDDSEDNESDY